MTSGIEKFNMDYFSLKGKVAIITGANQGLGMGYATAFAKAGADLLIPHLTDDIAEVKELVEKEGRKVVFIQGDVTKEEHRKDIVDTCMKEFGRIDILVNNAGIGRFHDFLDYPDSFYQSVMEVNLNAVYYLSHAVAQVMKEQRSGKIINIGSALSYTADKKCPPYVVAKHGIIGLTRTFANELGEFNIQTNAISPGFLVTEVNAAISNDQVFYDKINSRIPAGRWGDPEDLMGTVVFLASKASDYINGWSISVDGGFTTTL
ncbi:SDR family oxidoreductase [Alkalibacter rhizosphaerae]|uniref:SDR family oxidoreductase n=1 Tax=Alkalibacter rhizosphaerae TaxID=2815577 RepID=A0A974XDL1_9FIRM|nr:SDR family oxidoreductase [Alkalibacter rhizosphaerae]QSX07874.1 SDR family oxidoreductase [Alkalibacter rhizosphaerae]